MHSCMFMHEHPPTFDTSEGEVTQARRRSKVGGHRLSIFTPDVFFFFGELRLLHVFALGDVVISGYRCTTSSMRLFGVLGVLRCRWLLVVLGGEQVVDPLPPPWREPVCLKAKK